MKKIYLLFFLFLWNSLSNAIVVGDIVTIQHKWPDNTAFNKISFFLQVNNDGGSRSNYYWANQFNFINGDTGYIGLQNRQNGIHAFHYSIKQAKGWRSGNCRYFYDTGTSVQCDIVIQWKAGHLYRLDVSKEGNLVTGFVTDLMDGTSTTIGIIEVPNNYGKLNNSRGFVDEYSHGNNQLKSCYDIGAQASMFRNPLGDNRILAKQLTYTSGNCNNIFVVHAACNDGECINTISNLNGSIPPNIHKVAIRNSQNILLEQIATALNYNALIAIRTYDGSWAPKIYFPDARKHKFKSIYIKSDASYTSFLYFDNKQLRINKSEKLMFVSDGNQWIRQ
ncbi:MAG TPA: DUF3472 domain-containing protein [Arsenophonus apicola]|jgi:hypothetical protein|uniref:DUF3472 domain-containing protein n=1 Tax=Arsenophonus apicola TaxID=2879119 RepID=UPI00387A0BAA